METFNDIYARFYDVMYAKKTYEKEAQFVIDALASAGLHGGNMLSLGAGTLNHEVYLTRAGYRILGMDISAEMVRLAQEKILAQNIEGVEVRVGDMRKLEVPAVPYDVAVIMFNVISYCADQSELQSVFRGVSGALRSGGLFLLDYWNAEAVVQDPPRDRWKKYTLGDRELYRLTKVEKQEGAALELDIELLEIEKDRVVARGNEHHSVRGWHPDEVTALAKVEGMELVHTCAFPEWNTPASAAQWPIAMLFRKG